MRIRFLRELALLGAVSACGARVISGDQPETSSSDGGSTELDAPAIEPAVEHPDADVDTGTIVDTSVDSGVAALGDATPVETPAAPRALRCRIDEDSIGPELACPPDKWCTSIGLHMSSTSPTCRSASEIARVTVADGGAWDEPTRCGDGFCGWGGDDLSWYAGFHRCEIQPDGNALCVLQRVRSPGGPLPPPELA